MPPGPSARASCAGPSAARDERDKTRSPRPPGPGPTGQLGLSIYLWSSLCMYRSHFRLQIKSRDNQPGWTRTLQGRGAASQPGPLRPGIHSLHRVFLWRACGGSNRIPASEGGLLGRRDGQEQRVFLLKATRLLVTPHPPQSSCIQASPILSTAFGPPATLLGLFPRSLIINNEEPLLPR